jgi:hypothetical protein
VDPIGRELAILRSAVFPREVAAVEDVEFALRQTFVQAFGVGDWNKRIMPADGDLAGRSARVYRM